MKKGILFLIVTILSLPLCVWAKGSASISGASTVEVGNTVTISVTLKNTAAWDIDVRSSGATSGCSQSFADATSNGKNTTKTLSVKCKATSTGTIGFTVSGDITSEDEDGDGDGENSNVSLSKRVTVVPARVKSSDATLASLTVEGYELIPAFSKDNFEYTITVPSTVNTVKIDAKRNESHATVSGTGEMEVSEGINTFEIVVTAETGVQKKYILTVQVEDTNPIEVKIGETSYTIIKNAKNLTKPEYYEEKTIEINGFSIPAYWSDITKFTLIGLKDPSGKVYLAIYKEESQEYFLYNETKSSALSIYLTDFKEELKDYQKATMVINDIDVPIYKFEEDSRFVLCYGMNLETGKYEYYSYDTKEGTFQVWNQEEMINLQKNASMYFYVCIAFGVGLFASFFLNICLLTKKNKKSSRKKNKTTDKNYQEDTKNEEIK